MYRVGTAVAYDARRESHVVNNNFVCFVLRSVC